MAKNLEPISANYKLCTTNYTEKETVHDGRDLRATGPIYGSLSAILSFRMQTVEFSTLPVL